MNRSVGQFGRSVCRSVGRSIDRSSGRSIGRSVDRSFGRPVGWWVGLSVGQSCRPIGRPACCSLGLSVGRWIDRSIGNRSVSWSVGWPAGRSVDGSPPPRQAKRAPHAARQWFRSANLFVRFRVRTGELPESDQRRVLVVCVNGRGRVARRAGRSHAALA